MSFLEDIAIQLNTTGAGVYPGTSATRTIYIGEMPDSPDACIALYARPGRAKALFCDLQYPELHVEVRAATYSAAQSTGTYYIKIIIPNGIEDEYFFSM